jgi:magnesium transporter
MNQMRNERRRRRWRRHAPPGSAPGTLVSDPHASPTRITVTGYGAGDGMMECRLEDPAELPGLRERWPVLWIDAEGLADQELLRRVAQCFDIHHLALADAINVNQRPKAEEYGDHLFIVTRMVECHEEADGRTGSIDTWQIGLFVGRGWILSFRERPDDCFAPVRERLRHQRGRIRLMGADYLAYALLDSVADAFFPVLERYGEWLDRVETAVMTAPDQPLVGEIHHLRSGLLTIRRAVWPQREMLNTLIRDPSSHVEEQVRLHLRDVYDHVVEVLDMVETYREVAFSLLDVYLSSLSSRMNEIMKVLAIISTIFIPLSFIAGIYGMNFDGTTSPWNMPELEWYFGYPFALALMAAVAAGLLLWFRRRGWIGSPFARRGRRSLR